MLFPRGFHFLFDRIVRERRRFVIIKVKKSKEVNRMGGAGIIKKRGGDDKDDLCGLSVLTDSVAEESVLANSVAEKWEVSGWIIVET